MVCLYSFSTIQQLKLKAPFSVWRKLKIKSTYPNKILKNIFKLVSPLVKKINKQVLNRGLFSESLKNALVVPIFKTGDRNNFTNYRPISILPVFSKVFEKNVHKQVQSYLGLLSFSILLNLELDLIFQPLKLCLIPCSIIITIQITDQWCLNCFGFCKGF